MRFDLWMSKGMNDIFALVINFLGIDWQPKHVTLGFFEGANISKKLWPKVWLSYLKSITQEGGGIMWKIKGLIWRQWLLH